MGARYVLAPPPEHGGLQFWEINDMQEMYAIVAIHKSFPNVEQVMNDLYKKLLRGG